MYFFSFRLRLHLLCFSKDLRPQDVGTLAMLIVGGEIRKKLVKEYKQSRSADGTPQYGVSICVWRWRCCGRLEEIVNINPMLW